jgi:pimeloyl-ACP methyl ester carboxylesterase
MFAVTDHAVKTGRHTSFYLACGARDAPSIVFVHGWPELSISWRHQLPCFAALGFRAIAPDMRGYGRSTAHPRQEDYAQEHIVADMIELLDSLGQDKAIWVGHDWVTTRNVAMAWQIFVCRISPRGSGRARPFV